MAVVEEWRTIARAPNYSVSNHGRVRRETPGRRTAPGRMMMLVRGKVGYLVVSPTVDGRNVQMYVHRIVAAAFLGSMGGEVNHIDGDKTNNHVSNLEVGTHASNMAHAARTGLMVSGERHHGAKLSDAQVAEIRALADQGVRNGELARRFGVAPPTITQITKRQRRAV